MKRILPLVVLLGLFAACDGGADDPEEIDAQAKADQTTLEICASSVCGDWKPFYGPDKGAVSCILDAAASGSASSAGIMHVADGGAHCWSETRMFVVGDGVAYLWEARDSVCDDEALFDEYELQRCLVDMDAVANCQAQVEGWDPGDPMTHDAPDCADPSRWLTGCVAADEASCG